VQANPKMNDVGVHPMAKEMADSRVFAGIHYQASCDKGRWLGDKIGKNILRNVQFLKHGHHDGHEDYR